MVRVRVRVSLGLGLGLGLGLWLRLGLGLGLGLGFLRTQLVLHLGVREGWGCGAKGSGIRTLGLVQKAAGGMQAQAGARANPRVKNRAE